MTNCANLTEKIKQQEDPSLMKKEQSMSYAQATLGSSQKGLGEHKVLGVLWNRGRDEYIVALGRVALEARSVCPTKRSIVSTVGKFRDPLGILSPVIVTFKILFQELCKEKREWDQPITGQLSRCYALIDDLMSNEPIIIEIFECTTRAL